MKSKIVLFLSLVIFLNASEFKNDRWYSQEQLSEGKELFIKNCSACHGSKAEKTIDWKKPIDGFFPPPPLNGSAHAWHHPKSLLKDIVANGGTLYKGKMPPFKDVLSDSEQEAVISYFQNFWSDKVYKNWVKYGGLTR